MTGSVDSLLPNKAQYPNDVIAPAVLASPPQAEFEGLAEMFPVRSCFFSYGLVRQWEAKLAPVLSARLW